MAKNKQPTRTTFATQNSNGQAIEKSPIAKREEEILAFWKEREIFKKTLEKPSPKGDFIFYEGPPTANGKPGIHHLESRAFKDAIPRYKTMQGFRVPRKAGWDTHGLPVELEVEKKLGLKSKKEIETYGVAKFNEECKKNVWTYVDLWEKFSERVAYWLDFKNPYITYTPDYIESVWNIIKKVYDKDLLYKDYKVVPWCPRCGTALSSHELAQGYEDVKDLSVTVEFRVVGKDNTSLLAWTTTPWTLPGNVALAVGANLTYVVLEKPDEGTGPMVRFILAKNNVEKIFGKEGYKIVEEMKGNKLAGMEYEPLYPYLKDNLPESQKDKLKNAFKVYEADFVTTEDGTGIVHTAVMYGQDDFELGTKVGLPKHHLVGEDGKFLPGTGDFAGRFVRDEDVAVDIIKDLARRGFLFKKEKYEHSYPHCWRCKTPLIYFARDSWYIKMSSLREELLSENQKIHWEPEHIKGGRFGEWLSEVKDWAISRERYWGTPLPIWISEDKEEVEVIGSIEEIKKRIKKSGNKYFVARHGEADHNLSNEISYSDESNIHLTEKGRRETLQIAEKLRDAGITQIFSSPFTRTKETAEMVAEELGLSKDKIIFDKRLAELNPGTFEGKTWAEKVHWVESQNEIDYYRVAPEKGESHLDAKVRFGNFLYEIESKYKDENILVITHGVGIEVLPAVVEGADDKRAYQIYKDSPSATGVLLPLNFIPIPHNENFELDLHKPYIDDVVLISKSGKEMLRVKEVMDVWFDSGAMPYASYHYPFDYAKGRPLENTELPFPADYISEAIDQTRGWFYTLHAIGVLLGRGLAYKNVICLGHILDKDGLKMSKSRGNALDPWEQIDKYGVDVLRYWMYTVNQPGESKNFDERTVDDVVKKVFNLYLNVVKFYELHSPESGGTIERIESPNPLDRWILSKSDSLNREVTQHLDEYKLLEAGRALRDFIAELSQWYVRRSRDRFRGSNQKDKNNAINTLGFVLMETSKLMAPFMPFLAEDVYQRITKGRGKESVHLEEWSEPTASSAGDVLILTQMDEVRRIVGATLEARARAQIKIRQPLGLLTIKSGEDKLTADLLEIIMDEVNVKDISFDKNISEEVMLDTVITDELEKEGNMRELVRSIQEFRKENNLSPGDPLDIVLSLTPEGRILFETFESEIKSISGLRHTSFEVLPEKTEPWFSIALKS